MIDDYGPSAYGDHIAAVYDEWTSEMDPAAAVDLLANLAPEGGRALELGIGTGRVALPLARRGLEVHGIDASSKMLDRLRAKPGAEHLVVHVGNFADVEVPHVFDLVYIPYSTLFALPSQTEQLRCLCNVVAHLLPGGHFVLDAFVPEPERFTRSQSVSFVQMTARGPRIDVARHDPVDQRIESMHLVLGPQGTDSYPVHLRYAWPAELDALALAAGLEAVSRYGGYDGAPFTAESGLHVSIYRRPPADEWESPEGSAEKEP